MKIDYLFYLLNIIVITQPGGLAFSPCYSDIVQSEIITAIWQTGLPEGSVVRVSVPTGQQISHFN